MAGLGCGVWDSMEDLRETWKLDREFTPTDSARVKERVEASYVLWLKGVERARSWTD